jgi:hypothetical protein
MNPNPHTFEPDGFRFPCNNLMLDRLSTLNKVLFASVGQLGR